MIDDMTTPNGDEVMTDGDQNNESGDTASEEQTETQTEDQAA